MFNIFIISMIKMAFKNIFIYKLMLLMEKIHWSKKVLL